MGIGEEIARVAYELYEKRGKSHGCDMDDWLQAEKIVRERHARNVGAVTKLAKSGMTGAIIKSAKGERAKPAAKASSGRKASSRKTGR